MNNLNNQSDLLKEARAFAERETSQLKDFGKQDVEFRDMLKAGLTMAYMAGQMEMYKKLAQ